MCATDIGLLKTTYYLILISTQRLKAETVLLWNSVAVTKVTQ